MLYPEVLSNAISSFKKLPGIGEKSAERYALSILELSEEDIDIFVNNIKECKNRLGKCKICGHLSDGDTCSICNDDTRKNNVICVVEDYKSVFMFEKTGNFEGIYPEDINIYTLIDRIKDEVEDAEIILALKPSIEGETTTLYIKKIFENKNIKVSRLSYGIPMGVEIDYLDSITLDRALLDRKEIS